LLVVHCQGDLLDAHSGEAVNTAVELGIVVVDFGTLGEVAGIVVEELDFGSLEEVAGIVVVELGFGSLGEVAGIVVVELGFGSLVVGTAVAVAGNHRHYHRFHSGRKP
jgi:thiazole synthase ThiGH ThiG subunit